MSCTKHAVFLAALVSLISLRGQADELTTSSGKKLVGKVLAVNAQGVTFKTTDAEVKVSPQDVVLIDLGQKVAAPPPATKYVEVELTDSSVIRCSKFLIKGKSVAVELFSGPENVAPPTFELPMSSVFSVLRGADEQKNRDEWKRMLESRGKRDIYVTRQADGLVLVQGTVIEGNAAGDVITFERDDGTRAELRLARATGGLVFSQPQPAKIATTLCKVLDVFGNSWYAQAVEFTPKGLKVTTVAGVVVDYPSQTAIAKLDYSQGNIAYLSDLEAQVFAPELPADEPLKKQFDPRQPIGDQQLKLDNQVFPKGLWLRPTQDEITLVYALGGEYREFKAVVGIADAVENAPRDAGVKLTIEGDGRVLFSEAIKPGAKPKNLVLDVKSVKQLRVMVSPLIPFQGNEIILGNAQVQK